MSSLTELLPSIDEKFQIKIYGKKVTDFEIDLKKESILSPNNKIKLVLVKIYGTRLFGDCIILPKPFFTLLPDNGIKPDGCGDLGNPEEYLMWVLGKGKELLYINFDAGSAEDIIKREVSILVDVNADFRIHDIEISGTKVSAKLRAYLRLRQPGPFGSTLFDITVLNGDYPFSVDLNTCVTVFSVAVTNAEVCFRTDPNRVCGVVNVGIDLPILGRWSRQFEIACINV
jgi:uncharacterized protein YuzE